MAEQSEENKHILSVKVVNANILMMKNTSNKILDITDWANNLNHVKSAGKTKRIKRTLNNKLLIIM